MHVKAFGLALGLVLGGALSANAHEVHHRVDTATAIVVTLTYADGKPFSFEAYEVYADGQDLPAQVGRTDGQGRALFVPSGVGRWRIKAYSADGHGADQKIDVPAIAPNASAPASADQGPNRASLLVFGLSMLLGAFGLYQLWLRRRP